MTRVRQIVDNMAASLVLKLNKSYFEVLDMDFEDFVKTYSIFYVNHLNETLALESKK